MRQAQRGFDLVDLLIVIVILVGASMKIKGAT
jgi:Tfp pilus assembly protein PilE